MGKAWHDLGAQGALAACIRGSFREVYGYVGLLAGSDRGAAEGAVGALYARLAEAVDSGTVTSMSQSRLRHAARTLWLERQRLALLAQGDDPLDESTAVFLADLSDVERAVVVLRLVDRMPLDEVASQLELAERQVGVIERRAIRRLAGDRADATDVVPRLQAHFGDAVLPRPGFREELVAPYAGPMEGPTTSDVPAVRPDHVAASPPPPDATPEPDVADAAPSAGTASADDDQAAPTVVPAVVPPAAPEPEPPRSRRRVLIVAGGVVVLVLAAALVWGLGRGDDEDAAPETTVGQETTVAVTSTVPAPVLGFDPVCADRAAVTDPVPVLDEGSLNVFGPLGAEPGLTIDLPASVTAAGPADARADVLRVGGGVLVTVRSNDVAPFDGSIVARVDAGGVVRWVRCFAENVEVRSTSGPVIADAAAIAVGGTWQELSLVDGSTGADVAEPAPTTAPPAAASPDPAVTPIAGARVSVVAAPDVTVVFGCVTPDPAAERGCAASTVRGYSPATGALVWQRDGVLDVAAVQDGFALILFAAPGADPAWYMIRVVDGTAVDGQVWGDADAFTSDCCAAAPQGIGIHGGVVVEADYGSVAIWYPAVGGVGAAAASLP